MENHPLKAKPEVSPSGKDEKMLHNLENGKKSSKQILVGIILIVVLGIGSGYGLHKAVGKSDAGTSTEGIPSSQSSGKVVVGSKDASALKDSAEGTLQEGGIDGEGTHKLIRPGGDSQTVYLNSSSLDLSPFVGKKVKVYGETFAGKKAGWLMDVGKVEVLQ